MYFLREIHASALAIKRGSLDDLLQTVIVYANTPINHLTGDNVLAIKFPSNRNQSGIQS